VVVPPGVVIVDHRVSGQQVGVDVALLVRVTTGRGKRRTPVDLSAVAEGFDLLGLWSCQFAGGLAAGETFPAGTRWRRSSTISGLARAWTSPTSVNVEMPAGPCA
jgi:hypothetical protein